MTTTLRAQTSASAPSEEILLHYKVLNSCADETRFIAQVQELTPRARVVSTPRAGVREFFVHIEQKRGRVLGRLEIVDASGTTTREVAGKTCDEVVSALALATALAVDPTFGAPSPPEVKLPESEPEPKPKPESKPKLEPKPPAAPTPSKEPKPAPPRVREAVRQGLFLEAGGFLSTTQAPRLVGGTLGFGFERAELGTLSLSGNYAPAQRVTDSAYLGAWAVRLDAGVSVWESQRLRLETHLAFEAGQVTAEGRGVPRARTAARPWAAVDIGAGCTASLVSGLYLRPLIFAELPLVRQRFSLVDASGVMDTVHEIPAFGLRGSVSLGVTFK